MVTRKLPGPACNVSRPLMVEDGTLSPRPSPVPGPVCSTKPEGLADYARRIGNVKSALMLGLNRYAYSATVAKFGSDLQTLIDSLWPGFVQALQIYAVSIGTGAMVVGVVGAVVGEGFGAVPGAILGAQLGAEVASVILLVMGLKFLAEYVLAHLEQANRHFRLGFELAWQACGVNPNLDTAGREFGRGVAELFSLILQAAVAWLIKKGLNAGLKELNRSKMGRALAPYAKVQYWIRKLGVTDAPIPRRGIATTIEFFENQLRLKKLDPMDESKLYSYWKAMDFSREVSAETLGKDKVLVGYRDPSSPYGFYYTEPGTFLDRVGIDYVTERTLPSGAKQMVPREFIRYRVKKPVEVLKSISSGVRAHDTKRAVPGGGTQYFIPRAWEVLEIID